MPRRRGQPRTGQDRGRSSDPSSYYVSTDSDVKYRQKARQRVRHNVLRTWLIRFLVLAALVTAGYLWGDDVVDAVKARGRVTAREFEGVGDHIREGADRRGGAEWVEGSP
jgi:hypothetical protein